jgi:aspartyl-tRNA(Asn)/glutamyl-tRNA(Gln) amidotransferase subunit A
MKKMLANLSGLLASTVLLAACGNSVLPSATPTRSAAVFKLEESNIEQLHAALLEPQRWADGRTVTCESVVEAYLDSIAAYDLDTRSGPPLNAFVLINANARDQARSLDAFQQRTGRLSGPLHCVVTALKDTYDSFDSPTSAGTLALLGSQPLRDGYAVAAMVSLGADNCGSNRLPAAYAGLVSLRGSYGLVSQGGTVPTGNVDGIEGPMARSVRDMALLLDAMAGRDPLDSKTLDSERRQPASYTQQAKTNLPVPIPKSPPSTTKPFRP